MKIVANNKFTLIRNDKIQVDVVGKRMFTVIQNNVCTVYSLKDLRKIKELKHLNIQM